MSTGLPSGHDERMPRDPARGEAPGQELLFGAPTTPSPARARVRTTAVATTAASAIVVATDGSCLANPGPGGWCWYADEARWAAGGETHTTNNQMELLAVLEALRSLPSTRPLLIRADSRYTIDACTKWIHGWKRRGWKTAQGAPVKNREIIEAIHGALDGRAVTFEWVKGHAGHSLNEAADGRCRAAAEAMKWGHAVRRGPGW